MLVAILSILFFLTDFFVKISAQTYLAYNDPLVIIPNILWLRLVYNTGAAFGLFQGRSLFLALTAVVFLIFVFNWLVRTNMSGPEKVSFSMIIGGVVSNLWDRVHLGYVVDYIDFGWWPVFNFSDAFICVGCGMFVFLEFVKTGKRAADKKNKRS